MAAASWLKGLGASTLPTPEDSYSTEEVSPGVYAQTPNANLTGIGQTQAPTKINTAMTGGITTPQTTQAVQKYVSKATNKVDAGNIPILPKNATDINPATKGFYNSGFVSGYDDPFKMIDLGATGWAPELQSQLTPYGISQVPQWMLNYGIGNNYERSDFGQAISKALSADPMEWLNSNGKTQEAMQGWQIKDGKIVDTYGNTEFSSNPTNLAAAQQKYLDRKFQENTGGFNAFGQEGLGLASVLLPMAVVAGWAAAPAAGGAAAAEGGAGAAGGGLAGATAAGAGETAAMGTAALGAGLPASTGTAAAMGTAGEMAAATGSIFGGGAALGAGGSALSPEVAEAVAAGEAAGADVGMGAGTSWLTDLGLPAAYGNDLGALAGYVADMLPGSLQNLDFTSLFGQNGLNIGSLIGGGGLTPTGTQPTSIMGGGTTSAPQTSPIPQGGAITSAPSGITPAVMPTGSIMGAFAPKSGDTPDYMKYLSPLF